MATLPGFRGADHIGITVPDIDQALDFFVNILGFERFYSHGPFGSDTDDWMQTMLNVHPRAKIRQVTQLRCGAGPNIELFQYEAPDQRQHMPRNSDWGGHHIAISVDDIDAAVNFLKGHGVRIMNNGVAGGEIESGPEQGGRSVYFLTPWGMQMELMSYPKGKNYINEQGRKLWDAARPEQ